MAKSNNNKQMRTPIPTMIFTNSNRMPTSAPKRAQRAKKSPANMKRRGMGNGRGARNRRSGYQAVPLAISRPVFNNSAGQVREFTGKEMLDLPTLPSTSLSGELLFELPLIPSAFPSTRLGKESRLWRKWRPLDMEITIIPSAPTTVSGAYVAAIDSDPTTDYAGMNGLHRIQALTTLAGGGTFQYFQGCNIKLQNKSNEWLFCNEADNIDPYRTTAGVAAGAIVFPPQGLTGSIGFILQLNYRVQFMGQSLDEPGVMGATEIYATGAYRGDYPEVLMGIVTPNPAAEAVYLLDSMLPPRLPTGSNFIGDLTDFLELEFRFARAIHFGSDWYLKFYRSAADARSGAGAAALQRSIFGTLDLGGTGQPGFVTELLA